MPLDEVVAALNGEGPVRKEQVLGWMHESSLETHGAVYRLTDREWNRIQPELSMEEQCWFMTHYLIECIVTDSSDSDWILGGFEASHELAAWIKHLYVIAGTSKIISGAAAQLTTAYRRADDRTRKRIETGALEHIFEQPALRTYFAEWRDDPELQEAYKWAAAWGDDHLVGSGRSIEEIAQNLGGPE
ncbi:MAG: hypothetical protein WAL95_05305 [Candidatus Acidiferrales bacterium]